MQGSIARSLLVLLSLAACGHKDGKQVDRSVPHNLEVKNTADRSLYVYAADDRFEARRESRIGTVGPRATGYFRVGGGRKKIFTRQRGDSFLRHHTTLDFGLDTRYAISR